MEQQAIEIALEKHPEADARGRVRLADFAVQPIVAVGQALYADF